jgi:hypothetical protein
MMILGEVASRYGFTWRLSLPTWGGGVGDVDGLRYIVVRQGDRAFFHVSSFLVTTVGGSTFQGM